MPDHVSQELLLSRKNRARLFSIVLVAGVLLPANVTAQSHPQQMQQNIRLKGRVLAEIASLTMGAGVGPQYQTFIFGVETTTAEGKASVQPVEILYAFFKDQGPLRESFYDHSKLYELEVERDRKCDLPLRKLAYETNSDQTGKELPPTNILYVLYGAPRDLFNPDVILPCYVLLGHRYKVVSQDAERITRCDIRVPPELQDSPFSVIYAFDTEQGKPTHVKKIKNDVLPDDGFAACISRWIVPSMRKGTATFLWNPADGWTLNVSAQSN
jgi:hypothetical protein